MDIAVHFDADAPGLGPYYAPPIYTRLFTALISCPVKCTDSNVCVGDVPLFRLEEPGLTQWVSNSSELIRKKLDLVFNHNIFAVFIHAVPPEMVGHLDRRLRRYQPYVGIVELHGEVPIHHALYKQNLVPFGRIVGNDFHLLWDGLSEDSKDKGTFELLKEIPFDTVQYECRLP